MLRNGLVTRNWVCVHVGYHCRGSVQTLVGCKEKESHKILNVISSLTWKTTQENSPEKRFCFCPMRQARWTNRSSSALILHLFTARLIYTRWMMIWVTSRSSWRGENFYWVSEKYCIRLLSSTQSPLSSKGDPFTAIYVIWQREWLFVK